MFADPNNEIARGLQADALEQTGYQAEPATWRNFFLTAALELRNGAPDNSNGTPTSPTMIEAMTLDTRSDAQVAWSGEDHLSALDELDEAALMKHAKISSTVRFFGPIPHGC